MASDNRISLAEASRRSGRPLNRGRSDELDEGTTPNLEELADSIFFSPDDGRIWLNDQRMLLLHSATLARLRRELIDVMGVEQAKAVFTRAGYEQGARDAQLIRSRWPDKDIAYAFAAGPKVHSLEGFVKATTVQFEFDIDNGEYRGEFLWHESSEADEHLSTHGLSHSPVCWMQCAYATGYTSWLVGKVILFREMTCRAQGHPYCRILSKPLADWGDEAGDIDLKTLEEKPREPGNNSHGRSRRRTPRPINPSQQYSHIVGMSSSFTAARHMLERVADTNATTLLIGESGVGKELFAHTLHDLSPRRDQAFVAVNCAAIPESLIESELFGVDKGAFTGATSNRSGRFERASGGTLFLDEVASLSLVAQGKLLRVLQESEVERVGGTRVIKLDVRVVAATNVNLRAEVAAGRFREDLFFRLNVYPIELPPLRERRDDIPLLMEHFFKLYSQQHARSPKGFTHRAIDALLHYDYPGNLREMQNLIERGVIFAEDSGMIDIIHMFRSGEKIKGAGFSLGQSGALVKEARSTDSDAASSARKASDSTNAAADRQSLAPHTPTLKDVERQLYQQALRDHRGNVSAAARSLDMSRASLDYRLRKFGLLPAWGAKEENST